MPDQAGDGDDDRAVLRDAEFAADAAAGGLIGAEDGGIAAVADRGGFAVDVQAPCVLRLGFGDGEEDIGDAGGHPLHQERRHAAGE